MKLLFSKRIISALVILGVATTLGVTGSITKSVNATSMYTDFTAQKITRLNQETEKFVEQTKQYQATHPSSNVVRTPMAADPKQKVERIPADVGWGFGFLSHGPYKVSELWIVGDKPNYNQYSWNPYYAYSGSLEDNPNQGIIGTFVMNGASDTSTTGVWSTPELWGSVSITNITGNIIDFTTDSGVKGTFNLETHEWIAKK